MPLGWIEKGTAIPAEDLGTWPNIVETRGEERQQMGEGWSMGRKGLREITNI